MRKMLEKLASLERELADQRGDFVLFALLLRDEAPDVWDVVISAPWLHPDNSDDLGFIIDRVRAKLTLQEFLLLSRVVVLEENNPVLKSIRQVIKVRHGLAEFANCSFDGLAVKHAYIITSDGVRRRKKQPSRREK